MKFAVSMILLFTGTAACGTSGLTEPAIPKPPANLSSWTAVSLDDVARQDIRQAIIDLLSLIDVDWLWPEFHWSDHGIILVAGDGREGAVAYCVGICAPEIAARGTSRVWRTPSPYTIAPGEFHFMSLRAWQLRGSGEIVAVGFKSREQSVVTAIHEDFHLHYQSHYAVAFGDAIGSGGEMSPATRASLEKDYSQAESTARELREECTALADALHAGTSERGSAIASLRRFVAVRESRRARPLAPSTEEDFWERQEGVPTNLERRAAARMKFADRSAVAAALTENGCENVTNGSYLLVIGGLQAAVLDTFSNPQTWPRFVYPRDGTRAESLFDLVRALSRQSD